MSLLDSPFAASMEHVKRAMLSKSLSTLSHNLAIAGALCRAFELGGGVEIGEWQRIETARTV
jgi:hypothetical protein